MSDQIIAYAVIDTRDGSVLDVKMTRREAREMLKVNPHWPELRVRRCTIRLFKS